MSNKENIQEILDYLQTTEEEILNFDNEAIVAEYQENDGTQSLAIKILSVFGGILASLAFLGFLFIAGLYDSKAGLLIVGAFFTASAIYMGKKNDKKIILDTIIVSFFIIGFLLLGFAFATMNMNENIICVLFIVIAFLSIIIAQNYILSFISTLIISGSILSLILLNNSYELVHIYITAFVAIIACFFLKEAKIITTNNVLSKLYNPIRTGLTFSFLAGLVFVGKKGLLPISTGYNWLSSIVTISAIIYLSSNLFKFLNINKIQHKVGIYIFTVLALLPTAFSPAIPGTILLILLSFYVNYKTGLVLGIAAFIYFISQYYYDLNLTLLTKSILLFSSGVLFIVLYLFIHKNLTRNEKI
jgi:uncharacterized membrane protein